MSIWIPIVLVWLAVMLLLVIALTRMAARGDTRRDRHGSFPVEQLGERTAGQAVTLEVPEVAEDEPVSTNAPREPEVLGAGPEVLAEGPDLTDLPGEPEVGSSR